MKIATYALLGAALALSSAACKSNKKAVPETEIEVIEVETAPQACTAADPALLAGEWQVVELNGNPVTPNEENAPFLGFDMTEMRVFGNSGCNLLTGGIQLDSATVNGIRFGQIGSTRRFCPNDSIEQPFLTALSDVQAYCFANGDSTQVSLFGTDNQKRIGLQKRTAETPAK